MRNLTFSFILLSTAFTAGCTADIKEYMGKQKAEIVDYEYSKIGTVFGFDKVFPNHADKEREADKKLCFHKNSEERILTMEGVEDEVKYRNCVLAPIPTHQPQRMEGR